jgi:hypothetical protein
MCAAIALALITVTPTRALAHCDGMDGPVVTAAQRALDTRNPALVLIWVQPDDEREIQRAFDQTLAVRALGPEARDLADRFFFETLVRLHRAGEGAPFTGLKAAGRDLGPAIPAADTAIRTRSAEPVVHLLAGAVQEAVREQFDKVIAAQGFDPDDVVAGRAYVGAYVEFLHLVERLYEATTTVPHGHFSEDAAHATEP